MRKVNALTDTITTYAGNGTWAYFGNGVPATSAEFNLIQGIAVDFKGNLFICDTNSTVRKVNVSTGIITTVAGTAISGYSGDGTPATSAEILNPYDVAFDATGNYYIAEFRGRIREVDTFGIIHTVAGTTIYGYNGDGIPATSAELNETTGVSVDACGNLYIADVSNERIRKVTYPSILTVPIISLSGEIEATMGSNVTITASVVNAGCSYIIKWMNHGIQFTTTTVPSVTYTKFAGIDTITARVVSTATYGCYDSTTSAGHVVSMDKTGIAPPGLPQGEVIRTYPNPVGDMLHVDGVQAPARYRLLNMVGSKMREGVLSTGSNSIEVKELPGVYMLEVTDPSTGLRMTNKIVKR